MLREEAVATKRMRGAKCEAFDLRKKIKADMGGGDEDDADPSSINRFVAHVPLPEKTQIEAWCWKEKERPPREVLQRNPDSTARRGEGDAEQEVEIVFVGSSSFFSFWRGAHEESKRKARHPYNPASESIIILCPSCTSPLSELACVATMFKSVASGALTGKVTGESPKGAWRRCSWFSAARPQVLGSLNRVQSVFNRKRSRERPFVIQDLHRHKEPVVVNLRDVLGNAVVHDERLTHSGHAFVGTRLVVEPAVVEQSDALFLEKKVVTS